jgi:hypothetical protein
MNRFLQKAVMTVDPDDHYLISAHLAARQTYVIDLRTNKV